MRGMKSLNWKKKPTAEPEVKSEEGDQDLDSLIDDLLKEETESAEDGTGPQILDESELAAWDSTTESFGADETVDEKSKSDEDLSAPEEMTLTEEGTIEETIPETKFELDETGSAEEMPEKEESMFTAGPAEGQKTILVVDDSIVIRKMVEIALENESYNVISVATGKEAFSYLDDQDPDLVILDIMLPDVNGLDILKTIKAKKNIPVVMLSAKDTPKETSKAKELGANDFIPKPFRDEELVNKIHELIGQ